MRVYLLRHGIAHDRDAPDCPPDPQRALTDRGKARTRAAVRGMAGIGVTVDAVLTSPYLRARQTAAIASRALMQDRTREAEPLAALAPGGDLAAVVDALDRRSRVAAVLCAGHAPDLDRLLARLVGAATPFTHLKKAGLAVVDVARPGVREGRLVAVYPPRDLRRLARL